MSNIRVEYDGCYPNTCSGTLKIFENETEIYSNDFVCHSTGNVWFDEDWNEHVECGELLWYEDEKDKFSKEIQEAVRNKLSEFSVCCGGYV